jgi:hypothetical protein
VTGLTLSAALALGEAWLGITLAYYTDWPVSFSIAVLSAAAYFGSIMTPPWRGGSKIESIPKQQIPQDRHRAPTLINHLMPCSHSRPLICSGNQRIWRNFASILRRNGAISLRGLLRIACRA